VNIHPDKPLDGFTLRGIKGTCGQGITLANMRNVRLEDLDVNVLSGPKVAAVNVTGSGLKGAAALVPTKLPPAVTAASPPYKLGMNSGAPN
jgi:hypothetical protein